MSAIPSWMPDMSRNMALAGKTVSSKGMNVTYDELGYAVSATNFNHKVFEGTMQSVRAPSIEAVLGGEERSKYTGAAEDLAHFSNYDLEHVESWRQQVAKGEITAQQAYAYLESLRRTYGYSLGPSGNEFVKLEYTKKPGEVMAEERAAQTSNTAMAAQTAASTQPTASSAAIPAQPEASAGASSVQTAAPAQSGAERMQDSYQAELRRQQEQQTLKNELNDLRVDSLLKSMGEQKKDELFDILFEDEEKEEQNGL